MTQLSEGLGLDLADALPGDVELLSHLFQGTGPSVLDAEAQRSTFSSRGVRVDSTSTSCSFSRVKEAASAGSLASSSGMKSPRWLSSSSPMGGLQETGSWAIFRISRTRSTGMFISVGDLLRRGVVAQLLEQLA